MKRRAKLLRRLAVFVLILSMCFSTTVFADGEANEAAQAAKDAIMLVQLEYVDETNTVHVLKNGTGFLFGDGSGEAQYIITCNHVISLTAKQDKQVKEIFGVDSKDQLDLRYEVVIQGDNKMSAEVISELRETKADWAVLKLANPIKRKTLPFNLNGIGETAGVYALGFPDIPSKIDASQKYDPQGVTVIGGSVTKATYSDTKYNFIQHDATLSEGMSGGPLIDTEGNVVGINAYGVGEKGYYYALNIKEVAKILDTLGYVYETSGGAGNSGKEPTTEASGGNSLDKSILRALVSDNQKKERVNYPDKSAEFDALQEAIANANAVLDDDSATAEKIDEAKKQLVDASAALGESSGGEASTAEPAAPQVDKQALTDAISDAEAVVESDYSAESYSKLKDALDKANEIKNKADATQSEVDRAGSELKDAKNALEKKSNMLIWIIVIAGVVLLAVVILIVVLASRSKKNKGVAARPVQSMNPVGGMGGMGGMATPPTPPMPQAPPRPASYQKPPQVPNRSEYGSAPAMGEGAGETMLLNEGSGETTLLGENNQQMAVLVRVKTGEKINIAKKEFKIGKERSKVDYCITNNSVSRVHAIITFENRAYFVQDNQSTNYTYLNGEVIGANQKRQLKENDRIKFSDEEFIFKLA